MIAWKLLQPGAVGLFSGLEWPVPGAHAPGCWVEVEPPLVATMRGVHAVGSAALLDWLDDELWEIELGGEIIETEAMLVAERGRLLRRVAEWDGEAARELARSCPLALRDVLCGVLERCGSPEQARALAGSSDAAQLCAFATRTVPGHVVADAALAYLADVACLSAGGRPEAFPDLPGVHEPSTPAAIAANTCFVTAVSAGVIAALEDAAPDAFACGFGRERGRQIAWLADRLGLEIDAEIAPASAELAAALRRTDQTISRVRRPSSRPVRRAPTR